MEKEDKEFWTYFSEKILDSVQSQHKTARVLEMIINKSSEQEDLEENSCAN